MAANYRVRTRDVDGSGSRSYATIAGAVKRFEEMAGGTIDGHIAEALFMLAERGERLPKIEELKSLRAVSDFGTVVVFEAVSDKAIADADASRAKAKAAAQADADIKAAQKAGAAAYKAGLGRAPALNGSFTREAFAAAKNCALLELLKGYLYGWDIACLADGMPDDFPSVITLKSIEGAAS